MKKMSLWQSLRFITLGASVGLVALLSLRVGYYDLMGFMPNMAPSIAFFFLPVLLAVVMVVSTPIEAALRRVSFLPRTRLHAFFIGIAHASLLTWWAFPPNWEVFIVFNPITCRWFIGRLVAQPTVQADDPASGGPAA